MNIAQIIRDIPDTVQVLVLVGRFQVCKLTIFEINSTGFLSFILLGCRTRAGHEDDTPDKGLHGY